jgi:hypothetical protein
VGEGGPPLAWVAFPVVGDVGARWPPLAGRALHLATCTAALEALPASRALEVAPGAEYVLWALADERVLAVARDRLLEVLARVAPAQLRLRRVPLPAGPVEVAALADASRLLGYAAGEELLGLRYRLLLAEGEGRVVAAVEAAAPGPGTGLTLVPGDAPAPGLEAAEVERRLRAAGAWLTP